MIVWSVQNGVSWVGCKSCPDTQTDLHNKLPKKERMSIKVKTIGSVRMNESAKTIS